MTRSPRRLKQQVQETVEEQVRDLPLHAVRLAMFGVGRALLLTDRVTRDYKELREVGVGPVLGRLRDDAHHTAGKVVTGVFERVRGAEDGQEPAAETPVATPPKKVRPKVNSSLAAEPEIAVGKPAAKPAPGPRPAAKAEPAPSPKPAAKAGPAARPAPKPAAKAEPAPKPAPAPSPKPAAKADSVPSAEPPAKSKISADSLPVPNYDQATLAALRARLRGLNAVQVSLLRDYEREHAARPEVLRMYENRLIKLAGLNGSV